MKTKTLTNFAVWAALFAVPALVAAPIPKLFSTGLDDQKQPLPPNTIDPHYKLVESADAEYAGPNTYTLTPGFPVGPWLAESAESRWIAPRGEQGIGNAEGQYTFETTFDLTGFDPEQARITGRWAVDNTGVDIILNGNSLGLGNSAGFGGWTDFEIPAGSGFVEGTNTLQFVMSNAPTTPNPTGIRVELRGTVELPNEAPSIITQPTGATVLAGESVTLTVVADGTPPLEYQWNRNGTPIDGAIEATLQLTDLTATQSGNYTVTVKNEVTSTTSQAAVVNVFTPFTGLFNTGVDATGVPLEDGLEDPHYKLVVNPDNAESQAAIVHSSTVFPIVAGPWIANNDTSKWIGPRLVTDQAAGGDYVYETTFDLRGFDPATAFIAGSWTSDNFGTELLLNGINTGISNAGNFDTLNPFRINTGFVSGLNTLQFKVNNATLGFTGLRVQNLRGGAKEVPLGTAPTISTQPTSRNLRAGESVTLTVVASGTDPITYQWRRDGQNIEGATNPTLSFNPAGMTNSGSYTVVVSNPAGTVTSNPAVLEVGPAAELDITLVTVLTLSGLPGESWRVEYVEESTATNWQLLDTVQLTSDPFYYTDVASTNKPGRVYRLVPVE